MNGKTVSKKSGKFRNDVCEEKALITRTDNSFQKFECEEWGKGFVGTWFELFAYVFVECVCVCVTLEGVKYFPFLYFEGKDPKLGMALIPPPHTHCPTM